MSKRNWKIDPYQAELAIYNNLSTKEFIDKLYPDEKTRVDASMDNNQKEIDQFIASELLPGEEFKYVQLEYSSIPFLVSNKGRILTFYRGVRFRQVRVTENEGIIVSDSQNNKIALEDLMYAAGYDFDMETVVKFYLKTGYPVLKWIKQALDMAGVEIV